MPNFGSYPLAMRMRDAIKSLIREVLQEERPEYRYGTVQSVDYEAKKAMVIYNGDNQAVPLRMGAHRPRPGAVVRIDGLARDRHIAEIITGPGNTNGFIVSPATEWGITEASNQSDYPFGISAMFVNGQDGWPNHGMILTLNWSSIRFSQLWFAKNGGAVWFRGVSGNGPELSVWTALS